MRILIGLALGLGIHFSTFAQTIPLLEKLYSGNTVETSMNASKKNPKTQTYNLPATVTVIKQEGQHVEFIYKNANYQAFEIGTISADGKMMQVAYQGGSGNYNISGNKLVGCGSGRVREGLFTQWINSYYAWCDDMTGSK